MLPIANDVVGRDWLLILNSIIWGSVVFIMFLAKMKAVQDVVVAVILATLMLIFNAETLFAQTKWYKTFKVLKTSLWREMQAAFGVAFASSVVHNYANVAWTLPAMALAVEHAAKHRVFVHPVTMFARFAANKNEMRKKQLALYVLAQSAGLMLGLLSYVLAASFHHDVFFVDALPSGISAIEFTLSTGGTFVYSYAAYVGRGVKKSQ